MAGMQPWDVGHARHAKWIFSRLRKDEEANNKGGNDLGTTLTDALDGILMVYTYPEMGTVRVSFENGLVSFVWIAGPLEGEAGEDFAYRARKVGDHQFFVNWHEPEAHGFVTLYIDFESGHVHSSVLAAYATDDEQALFHSASIESVEFPQTVS